MRQPKPWYRSEKDAWYARVNGKRVSLGVRGAKREAAAVRAWHRLLSTSTGGKEKVSPEPKSADGQLTSVTLRGAADDFLADVATRVKPRTADGYRRVVGGVAEALGTKPLACIDRKALEAWLNRQTWGDTSKAHAAGVLSVFWGWAIREGHATVNPAKAVRKPKAKSRGAEAAVSDEVHARLLARASESFRPFLTLLRLTGARPSELAKLTSADVDWASGVALLADHKTAGKTGKPRVIFLTTEALAVLKPLAESHPAGALLRNAKGTAWTKDAVSLAMRRLCKRCGVKAILYGYRHGYATDALAKGVPDATVAALLGHSGTAMLHRHYSHLTSRTQAMRDAAALVRA